MPTLHTIATCLAIAGLSAGPARADQVLYVATTQGKTIATYEVNGDSGELSKIFSVDLPGETDSLAYSPDTSFLYAAVSKLGDNRSGVATFGRATDGSLEVLKTVTINGPAPYICADKTGRYLLAAHYYTGEVAVYRIVDGVCTDEVVDIKKTTTTAHCIEVDPSGRFVFVPHTAPNKVYQFRLDCHSGKLIPNDPPFVDGPDKDHKYHGPRHYAHHPMLNVAYTSNEAGGGITAWRFDHQTGTLSQYQTLSTLPPDFEGTSFAADIHLTPDGRFAYVSNRDQTPRDDSDPGKATLAGFAVDPKTGLMRPIGFFPTGKTPRSFCIDVTGHFLYAADQSSGTLFAYRIDPQTGELERIATYETDPGPVWVLCGKVRR